MPVLLMLFSVGAWGQDVTSFLTNADLSVDVRDVIENDNGWSTTGLTAQGKSTDSKHVNVVEFWGDNAKSFSMTQDVTLPKGTYRLVVNAFYRPGGSGGDSNNEVYIKAGDQKLYMPYLSSRDEISGNTLFDDGGLEKIYNNLSQDLQRASNAFARGLYYNVLSFTLDNEKSINIGIVGTFTKNDSWTAIGPIRLYKVSNNELQINNTTLVKYAEDKFACSLINHRDNSDDIYMPIWNTIGWDGLIKMYLGGWKYQRADEDGKQVTIPLKDGTRTVKIKSKYTSALSNVYPKTQFYYMLKGNYDGDGKFYYKDTDGELGYGCQADYWQVPKNDDNYYEGYPEPYFDGYSINSFASDNARSEYLAANTIPRHVYTLEKRGNKFGKGNPFTVPCFGGFMKFEPETNGTVVLYVLQNGIVDLSSSKKENGTETYELLAKATWRPTYIVDELGNLLQDEQVAGDGGVTAEVNGQMIYVGWDGTYTGYENGLPNPGDEGRLPNFKSAVNTMLDKLTDEQREWLIGKKRTDADITNNDYYWTTGGTVMKVMPPKHSGDGWVSINKAFIKYTFKVKAGKSYYVFNNDSKIGFCGYEFKPEQTDWKAPIEINEDNVAYPAGQYKEVKLTRSFKPGWNAICLPFSVTESQMRKAFGTTKDGVKQETYELVTYNGAKAVEDGEVSTDGSVIAHFFHHAYQDILAGYPYMLYIDKDADIFKNGSGIKTLTFNNILIEDDIEMATFNKSTDYIPEYVCQYKDNKVTSGTETEGKRIRNFNEGDFTFVGNFGTTTVSKGSYVVYSNGVEKGETGIKYVPTATPMKGLRSHLKATPAQNVKEMRRIIGTNFAEVFDESAWDDATVINDLAAEMGFFSERENVYSVTGQLVRQNSTSLVGLPKGIYIVNGKKYFVK